MFWEQPCPERYVSSGTMASGCHYETYVIKIYNLSDKKNALQMSIILQCIKIVRNWFDFHEQKTDIKRTCSVHWCCIYASLASVRYAEVSGWYRCCFQGYLSDHHVSFVSKNLSSELCPLGASETLRLSCKKWLIWFSMEYHENLKRLGYHSLPW